MTISYNFCTFCFCFNFLHDFTCLSGAESHLDGLNPRPGQACPIELLCLPWETGGSWGRCAWHRKWVNKDVVLKIYVEYPTLYMYIYVQCISMYKVCIYIYLYIYICIDTYTYVCSATYTIPGWPTCIFLKMASQRGPTCPGWHALKFRAILWFWSAWNASKLDKARHPGKESSFQARRFTILDQIIIFWNIFFALVAWSLFRRPLDILETILSLCV
jgi:hypothetical protein